MFTKPTVELIGRLVRLAEDFPGYENDLVNLIRKVVGPEPAPPAVVAQPTDPTVTEMVILENQGKIPAIKAYRERVHCGLREAKDAIEDAGVRIGYLVWDAGCLVRPQDIKGLMGNGVRNV